MSKWFKHNFSNLYKGLVLSYRYRPIMWFVAVFGLITGFINLCISAGTMSIIVGFSGFYVFFASIYTLRTLQRCALLDKIKPATKNEIAITNDTNEICENIDKNIDKNKHSPNTKSLVDTCRHILYCLAILLFFHFALSMVVTFFYDAPIVYKSQRFIYFTTISIFFRIVINIIQSYRTRKSNNPAIHFIKLLDLSKVFVSLALLQRTVLYLTDIPHAKSASFEGDILFGVIALIILIIMYLKYKRISKESKVNAINK